MLATKKRDQQAGDAAIPGPGPRPPRLSPAETGARTLGPHLSLWKKHPSPLPGLVVSGQPCCLMSLDGARTAPPSPQPRGQAGVPPAADKAPFFAPSISGTSWRHLLEAEPVPEADGWGEGGGSRYLVFMLVSAPASEPPGPPPAPDPLS